MKVKHVFVFFNREIPQAKATLDVTGIGEVQIDHALSVDLCERICAESVASLRLRLGQTLTDVPPAPTSDEALNG